MADAITVHAELTFEVDDETIETLIDMAGYGIGDWARWADWDEDKRTYTIHFWEDPDVESPMRHVTLSYRQVAEALVKLATNPETFHVERNSYTAGWLGKWVVTRDAAIIDAIVASSVIQVAVFDVVQYG